MGNGEELWDNSLINHWDTYKYDKYNAANMVSMTYIVSDGALNSTHSLIRSLTLYVCFTILFFNLYIVQVKNRVVKHM